VRLLLLHRRRDNDDDDYDFDYAAADGDGGGSDSGRRDGRGAEKSSCGCCWDCHDCCSEDDGIDAAAVADYRSGDREEFTASGIAGVPGLDVDRGVLIRRE